MGGARPAELARRGARPAGEELECARSSRCGRAQVSFTWRWQGGRTSRGTGEVAELHAATTTEMHTARLLATMDRRSRGAASAGRRGGRALTRRRMDRHAGGGRPVRLLGDERALG